MLNNKRICSSKRSTKTPISLPKRVGEAGCPWVLASIGTSCHSILKSFNFEVKVIKDGIYTFSKASFVESGIAVLLMSCEVSPKWMNSLCWDNPKLSNAFLMKYSTAFTSWLVTFSVSLIQSASSVEKFL